MAPKNKMAEFGYESAASIVQLPRIIMALRGRDGAGKTHFSLTAPAPIAYINLDDGLEGVIDKFKLEKEIHILNLDIPDPETEDVNARDVAEKEWSKFITAYYGALRSKEIRSVVIDTSSELRDLILLAEYGRKVQIMPYMYREPNAKLRKVIKDALKYDKNVIFLQKMRPVYIDDKRTKDYEPTGLSDMGHLVQVDAEIYQFQNDDDRWEFEIYFNKCRPNQAMKGETLSGEMCSFPWAAQMILPGVGSEVWE